jgi:hypothetical protein
LRFYAVPPIKRSPSFDAARGWNMNVVGELALVGQVVALGWLACAGLVRAVTRAATGVRLAVGEVLGLSFGAMVLWAILLGIMSGVLGVAFGWVSSAWLASTGLATLHVTTFRPSLWAITAAVYLPVLAAYFGAAVRRSGDDEHGVGWAAGLPAAAAATAVLLALGAALVATILWAERGA